ncbi:ABC transporter permease [Skermania sp. ID1734]|nr:ABC transporter permease [Skermania sp. ID1734]
MVAALKELYGARELVLSLTTRDLKSQYRATTLGHLWSLANPLTVMAVYTVVFNYIMRVRPEPGDPSGLDTYALWLLCGLLPWIFFTGVVTGGIGALLGGGPLIQKVSFCRSALVVSNSLALVVTWCIEMTVLLVAVTIAGADALLYLPMIAVFMALLWLFATGLALMFSVANVYFRDTQHFVTVLLQVWFFLTPLLYPLSMVVHQSKATGHFLGFLTVYRLYMLNPMSQYTIAFRNLIYDNRMPPVSCILLCVAWSLVISVAGLWVFKRSERGLAEAL